MINKETYKRLTAKKEDRYWEQEEFWQSSQEPSYEEIEELYSRLAELEDKIMEGTLVSIPFIWKNKKVEDAFVVVYESEHGDLFGKMFCGKNAKAEAEAKLKELQEGKK